MKLDISSSSLRFVYPFLFPAERFRSHVASVDAAVWQGGRQPLQVWSSQAFPGDDLLRQVADFLNPPGDTPPTARLWAMCDPALTSASGLGGGTGHATASWTLAARETVIPFYLEDVQLALFQDGAGFLTICARPAGDSLTDWLDFLHHFRFIRGQRGVNVRAQRRTGIDPATREPKFSPFFPEPAGGLAQHPEGSAPLLDVMQAILQTGAAGAGAQDEGTWWREVFVPGQTLPFATLFVDEVPDGEDARLLYRVRNFFHYHQEIFPAPEDLALDASAFLAYAQRQWFVFSLDGGAFVACDAPQTPFFRRTLPGHIDRQYYLLFLLALHQRFVLMMLSDEVARSWLPDGPATAGVDAGADERRVAAFERIRDALLTFTARGYFTQVMQQEHHHRCYRRWQEAFQVAALYAEVHTEVQEMYSYMQQLRQQYLQQAVEEQQRRVDGVQRRFEQFAFIIGVPSLAFFLIAAAGVDSRFPTLGVTLTGGVVGLLLGLVLYFAFSRWSLRRPPQ